MRKMFMFFAGVLTCGILAGCGKGETDKDSDTLSAEVSTVGMEGKDMTAEIPKRVTEPQENPEYTAAQDFSYQLFAEGAQEKNPVLSPVSAYVALSLAGSGARGGTAAEFQKVFGANSLQISEKLTKELPTEKEDLKISLANSVWVDTKMNVTEDFLSTAKNSFSSQVIQTDLTTERTMRDINWWIQDNTAGLIRDFLKEPLKEETMLALFNTVYFKGKWVLPFDALDTYDRPFTLDGGKVVNVSAMNLYRKQLSYIKNEHCEGIVLPYRNSDLVFVALKPVGGAMEESTDGVSKDSALKVRGLYKALDMGQIGALVEEAQTAKVNLHLPKFQVSFDRELNEDLVRMGLVSAFEKGKADFSGIGASIEGESVYISLVRQKAVFILDEEGTEAAAVTEAVMEVGAAMYNDEIVELDFNEPFLYMVFDPKSDLPLFIGIMDDPSAAE